MYVTARLHFHFPRYEHDAALKHVTCDCTACLREIVRTATDLVATYI